MIKLGRFQVSVEGLLALGLLVALSLGGVRCAAYRQGGDDARLAHLEANAHKASLAGIAARRVTDSVTKIAHTAERRVISQIAANRKVEARLSATLAANDSLLRIAPDSVDVPTLRSALQRTTEVARLFRDSTEVVLTSVANLLSAHEAERQAWLAERQANAAEIIAKDSLIAALGAANRCAFLRIPCPSRRTAFAAGVALTLAAVIAK